MTSERGSTIVEVIVALVVLGVAVLPVIGLMGAGYHYQGQARLDVQMATLAEAKAEELLSIARTDLPDTVALIPGGSLVSDAVAHWDTVKVEGRTFSRRWQVEIGPAGVRDVTIRVTPRQSPLARVVEVSTQVIHD